MRKICIYGNSVGLKMRPPRSAPDQRTYAELLEADGREVRNLSRAGILISDAFRTFDDDVIAWFPDAVVFNFGVVEVSRRRQPRRAWLETVAHSVFLNLMLGRDHPVNRLGHKARRALWLALRWVSETAARATGSSWQWLPLPKLLRVQKEMMELLFKETSAVAVVVGLNPCSMRVETSLPGSGRAISDANEALRAMATTFPRAVFVDPRSFIGDGELDRLVPDGVHYSAEGHRLLASRLREALERLGSPSASR